ncbi:CAP domain-containing protein [Actinophytocola sp. NPDC049390]|uniref:CAP domain-containing protein n=1 Tax=Actinophytocola sp. NPDC049390 TaxID=3363894 RepID=UPI00378E51A8
MNALTAIAVSAVLGLGAATGQVAADPSYERQVITLTNQERAIHGCGALTQHAALTRAARGHSEEMAVRDEMTHHGANGSDAGDRVRQAGYPARKWAENIAYGQATPEEVVDAWMGSSGHRANILDCGLAEIGVGHVVNERGVPYWTQNFGTR